MFKQVSVHVFAHEQLEQLYIKNTGVIKQADYQSFHCKPLYVYLQKLLFSSRIIFNFKKN